MSNRLHLVIGFDSVKARSNPTVIYCGRDATAARDAMVPEPAYAVKRWVRNPRGVRKVNPDFVSHRSVPATDTGEGDLPGEGATEPCPAIQQFDEYLAQLTTEQIFEQFHGAGLFKGSPREEMVASIIAYATDMRDAEKASLEAMSDEELDAHAIEAEVTFAEGLSREEKIALLLDGPNPKFQGAPPQGEEDLDPQGSTQLPGPDKGASASSGASAGGAPPTGSEAANPGSLTPGGKGKGKK